MIKKLGFTLVELLVTISILLAVAVILIGTINPAALIGRARDSRRKSDLNKFKITFEEYFNDKGFYPSDVDLWNVNSNCNKSIDNRFDINKYLNVLPCDPNGNVYRIKVAFNKYTVVTNLENKTDKDIPLDWYIDNRYVLDPGITKDNANYGVSSPNILWYQLIIDPNCDRTTCSAYDSNGCGSTGNCDGVNCYYGRSCNINCQTIRCP